MKLRKKHITSIFQIIMPLNYHKNFPLSHIEVPGFYKFAILLELHLLQLTAQNIRI